MNSGRVLYHMVRADFLERVRRYSFLLTLAASLYLAYCVAAEKIWIVVGNGYRGVYNSAWIGMLMSICCSTFLSLAGFYIVKNSVQRDADTRVGQILAATPMRKGFYTLAKTLSNFAVLASMVGILMLAAVAMQLALGEHHSLSLWKLWSPFVFLALPTMLLTASLAVLFETVPGLGGGFGNVAYFFLWTAVISLGATGTDDPMGLQLLYRSTRTALFSIDPSSPDRFNFSLTIGGERALHTFPWTGLAWTVPVLLMRLLWIVVAIGLSTVSAAFFRRFDPSRSRQRVRSAVKKALASSTEPKAIAPSPFVPSAAHLTPLVRHGGGSRLMQLIVSELRLMLKGQRWWWYTAAAGMLVGQLVSPDAGVRSGFLIAAWLWPILLWSKMGCRETRHSTGPLVFSAERSLSRQFPAIWAAGVIVTVLTGAGAGIHLAIAGDWRNLATWMAAASFIPALALALGVWSGGSRAFEALYTVWWYVGPAHQIPGLDFMGTTPASSSPVLYASLASILLLAAYLRRRQSLGYA